MGWNIQINKVTPQCDISTFPLFSHFFHWQQNHFSHRTKLDHCRVSGLLTELFCILLSQLISPNCAATSIMTPSWPQVASFTPTLIWKEIERTWEAKRMRWCRTCNTCVLLVILFCLVFFFFLLGFWLSCCSSNSFPIWVQSGLKLRKQRCYVQTASWQEGSSNYATTRWCVATYIFISPLKT